MLHRVLRPRRRFAGVTGCTWIWHFVLVCHLRPNEPKCVRVNMGAWYALALYPGHVTCDALATGAPVLVMRVRFKSGLMRAVRRHRSVTVETELIRRLDQLRVIASAMHVVAIETGDSVVIHDALHEIISLHPVLICRAIREVVEIGLTERAVFQPPIVL